MKKNYGKQFEQHFKKDFLESIPNSTIDRLQDQQSRYMGSNNICDFIGYTKPNIFYIECKCHYENTFPFSNLTQYDELLQKVGIPGVRTGVVIWFIDHDLVVYVPISTITKMKENGDKSVHAIKSLKKYDSIRVIPSTKLRVFLKSDYSILKDLKDGE